MAIRIENQVKYLITRAILDEAIGPKQKFRSRLDST